MRYLRIYWHALRHAHSYARLRAELLLLRTQLAEAEIGSEATATMLRTSRAEYDALLRRFLAVEHDYGEVCEELVKLKVSVAEKERRIPWATGKLIVEN